MSRTKTYKEWVVPFDLEHPTSFREAAYQLYLLEVHDYEEYRFFLTDEDWMIKSPSAIVFDWIYDFNGNPWAIRPEAYYCYPHRFAIADEITRLLDT